MTRLSRIGLAVISFAMPISACGGGGAADPPATGNPLEPVAVSEGKRLFEGTCAACHGFDALGIDGLGRTLVDSLFVGEQTDAQMLAFLAEGLKADHPDNITGVDMPPRGGNPDLTDQDLNDIVAYVRTLGSDT